MNGLAIRLFTTFKQGIDQFKKRLNLKKSVKMEYYVPLSRYLYQFIQIIGTNDAHPCI